mgnify:CR=1 FL=1
MKTNEFTLFSQLYTCYYHVVAKILEETMRRPLTRCQIEDLARTYGYDESVLAVVPRLVQGDWPFLKPDKSPSGTYSSALKNLPFPQPLTRLQKSWLKSLMSDSRIRLFFTDAQLKELESFLSDTIPLFYMGDFCLFDQYKDHDPFSSAMYREHMHTIMEAVCQQRFLNISYLSQRENILTRTWLPCRLEYGQRDGKFRLYAMAFRKNGRQRIDLLNAARILSVKKTDVIFPSPVDVDSFLDHTLCTQPLVLEISTKRNALERALLHFSCYQKKVERMESSTAYHCTIYYDKRWETELLIQVLSFGPVVKVLGPESFLQLMRDRLKRQALLMADTL